MFESAQPHRYTRDVTYEGSRSSHWRLLSNPGLSGIATVGGLHGRLNFAGHYMLVYYR